MTLTSELLASGQLIRNPVGFAKGYWAGAPGAFYASDEKAWYLTYRLRRPRGVDPDRGGEARIARSTDLQNWEDIWAVTKERYDSASIERSAIRKGPDGQWRYFTSYVDPTDGRWCVAMLRSADPRSLDASQPRNVFRAAPLGLEGVKDPWLFEENGVFHMLLSVALPVDGTGAQSHETLDIFNTGECVSATGLATSRDLDHWEWQGVVFAPESSGWDCYCRRINSVVPMNGQYVAFYDGSASHKENYEEKTGIAVSSDLKQWKTLTPDGPRFTSPFCTGSLRYIDAQVADGRAHLFHEFARQDGSHDLRMIHVDAAALGLE